MNKETFETIQELRNDGVKWKDIFNKLKHNFISIQVMKTMFTREQARKRTS